MGEQRSVSDLKSTQKSAEQEGKDKKKAERMAAMLAGLNAVRPFFLHLLSARFIHITLPLFLYTSQGGMSEKEAEIRASLARLDDAVSSDKPLSPDDIAMLRRQLEDSHVSLREQGDRSKQVGEENELLLRRRDELEGRLATLEQEYEELLGLSLLSLSLLSLAVMLTIPLLPTDKTLADDERADAANVNDIKVRLVPSSFCRHLLTFLSTCRTSSRRSTR
jgi:kinesin family protein 5